MHRKKQRGRVCLIDEAVNRFCNGLTVLPNESCHKAGNETDHKCYQDSYHPFFILFFGFE
jgi:hypothetical protein